RLARPQLIDHLAAALRVRLVPAGDVTLDDFLHGNFLSGLGWHRLTQPILEYGNRAVDYSGGNGVPLPRGESGRSGRVPELTGAESAQRPGRRVARRSSQVRTMRGVTAISNPVALEPSRARAGWACLWLRSGAGGAQRRRDLLDRLGLSRAHALPSLPVGGSDLVGEREDEIPVVIAFLGGRLGSQQCYRVAELREPVLFELLGRLIPRVI